MITYFGSQKIDAQYPSLTVVAIGNFDGVHLGHQAVLQQAKEHAKRLALKTTVFTFSPHPTLELRPETPLKLLMTYEEKRNQLEKLGVDYCVEEPFNASFAATSAHEFFFEILKNRLHAKVIMVGEDFAFGRKREGTLQLLQQYCEQTDTELYFMKPVMVQGESVSSSRIREKLNKGDLQQARELLGGAFFYRGEVIHGDKRGRTIGFPTANMKCEEKFPLLPGVYATTVFWQQKEYKSVTNIGTRPTFHDAENVKQIPLRIETHILNENFELYGETLEVRFHARLREERKFNSIDELKMQIHNDTILALKLLSF